MALFKKYNLRKVKNPSDCQDWGWSGGKETIIEPPRRGFADVDKL